MGFFVCGIKISCSFKAANLLISGILTSSNKFLTLSYCESRVKWSLLLTHFLHYLGRISVCSDSKER